MFRRNFLESLGVAIASLSQRFQRFRPGTALPGVTQTFLCEVAIAGLPYHDASELEAINYFELGDELILQREPENGHDSAAIAIQTPEGHMLGYVPKDDNAIPARLLDQGIALIAEVSALNPDLPNWGRMMVKIYQVLPAGR